MELRRNLAISIELPLQGSEGRCFHMTELVREKLCWVTYTPQTPPPPAHFSTPRYAPHNDEHAINVGTPLVC